MAINPFANAPKLNGALSIDNDYVFGIQNGNSTGTTGVDEMMHITGRQLALFCASYFGSIWNFRGSYSSALPTDCAVNDVFYCSQTFYAQTSDTSMKEDKTYYELDGTSYVVTSDTSFISGKVYYEQYAGGSFYAYTVEGEWVNINDPIRGFSDLASQYARGKKADGTDVVEGEEGYHDNAEYYSEIADNARIVSMTETESDVDGGVNTITITYKDGSIKTFTVKNGHTGETGATGPQGIQGETGPQGPQGIQGPEGPQGPQGTSVSIASQSVQYQLSASGTVVPTGEWLDTVPVVPQGQFLWTRTIVNYSPSGSTTSYSVAYQGLDGDALIDPLILLDGTKATYERVMRAWFLAKGAMTATPAELTALCDEWYTITRAGWNGYVVFNQPSESSVSTGTKGGDNAGLSCTPSTDTVANTDDYAGLPLFAIVDCNWEIDSTTLEPVITAIDGITSNFVRTDPDTFVGVLQMAPYHYYDNGSTTYLHGISDTYQSGHDYCQPVPEAVRLSDNTMRPWVVHSKYAAGKNDTKLTACAGVTPWAFSISHNTSQTYAHNIGSQYSGMCNCDRDWLVLMFYIKYGSLTADGILQGCVSYSYQYYAKVAETGVTRVLLSTANGANILVGSTLLVGAYDGSTDRYSASLRSISDIGGFKVLSKETVTIEGVDYTAINLDAPASFDTAANGDATTGTTIVSTFHWQTGTNDAVLGNDGSIDSPSNGKYPAKLQGIEYMNGAYEVLSDTILKLYQDASDEKYYYEPYHVNEASKQATSITANYVASGLKLEQPSSSSWQYPKKLSFNGKSFFYEENGGSSSTYLRDGFYMNGPNTVATRGWLLFGLLYGGSGDAGLSAGHGLGVLSHASWSIAGRLSPNGNRGEWTA